MKRGNRLAVGVFVILLGATLGVTSSASAQHEDSVCIRISGAITTDLVGGALGGTLGTRRTPYTVTGTSTANGDGTFEQRYTLDLGPFLTVRETPLVSRPRSDGSRFFVSRADVTAGGTGQLVYIGTENGITARYDVFGRVCDWGPDLVITNGAVHTVSGGVEEAVAIQDDRIIAVGSEVEILDVFIAGSSVEVIDVGGRAVTPAFVDAHSHVWEDAAGGSTQALEDERFAQGVTTVGEPTANDADITRLQGLAATGDLRLRTRSWSAYNTFCGDRRPGNPHLSWPVSRDPGAMFAVLGTKIFADGGACNAPAISFPYQPGLDPLPPSPQGDLYLTVEEMSAVVAQAEAAGHQVIIHAIGDVGVETAAMALSEVIAGDGNPDRHRIDHNVLVRPDVLELYVANDIGAVIFGEYNSCQHNRGGWWGQHLQADQIEWLHPWRVMADAGVSLGWQADLPYYSRESMAHWYSLTTFGQADAPPAFGGPGPCAAPPELTSHALTTTEALEAMTLGSATLLHLDREVGSIEVGKAADLVILSGDPLRSTMPTSLLDTTVVWTMTRGAVVYCDPAGPIECPPSG